MDLHSSLPLLEDVLSRGLSLYWPHRLRYALEQGYDPLPVLLGTAGQKEQRLSLLSGGLLYHLEGIFGREHALNRMDEVLEFTGAWLRWEAAVHGSELLTRPAWTQAVARIGDYLPRVLPLKPGQAVLELHGVLSLPARATWREGKRAVEYDWDATRWLLEPHPLPEAVVRELMRRAQRQLIVGA